MSGLRNLQSTARRNGPATFAILAAIAAVLILLVLRINANSALVFDPAHWVARPWTLLTYPLAITNETLIATFFIGVWLWSIGGALERDLGSKAYLIFFGAVTVIGALCYWAGTLATGLTNPLAGAFIPTAAVTVAWGVRNPHVRVLLFFIFPATGKMIAWLSAILVFVGVPPVLGAFCLVPLAAAWAFASGRLPGVGKRSGTAERNWRGQRVDSKYREEVRKREQDRKERERLRRIFENSLSDDERK